VVLIVRRFVLPVQNRERLTRAEQDHPEMRGLPMIALGIALAGSGSFAPSAFAQTRDADDCTTTFATFVREIDDLLARKPNDLNDVFAVLNRYFPVRVRGCTAEVALQPISKSSYFKGAERRGRITSFALSNATTFSRGAAIQVSVTDPGDWNGPFAIWWPPYP
jgi:hypothetical protein